MRDREQDRIPILSLGSKWALPRGTARWVSASFLLLPHQEPASASVTSTNSGFIFNLPSANYAILYYQFCPNPDLLQGDTMRFVSQVISRNA